MIDKQTLIKSFEFLYQKSLETDDYTEIISALEELKISNLVKYYIHHVDSFSSEDTIIVEYIIRILQNIYNNSGEQCPISDDEYDSLYEAFLMSSNTAIVGGKNVNGKETSSHTYPDLRGTLNKVHFMQISEKGKDHRKSIEEWTRGLENQLGRKLSWEEYDVALYPKFDGVSVVFECDPNGYILKALTRGDTTNNEAIVVTPLFAPVKFAPCGDGKPFGVKTEVLITYKNFEKLCKKYGEFKSPRSAASSIINSNDQDPKMLKYLTIVPLRYQVYGETTVNIHPDSIHNFPVLYSTLDNYEALKNGINSIKEYMKTILEIPIDGVVLQIVSKQLQAELGRVDAINKYEVAYKFLPESKKTILENVEFSVGVLGTLTPVAKIKPVKMEGNTINNVSLGSMDRFESLHLSIGDEVLIKYDIIPYLYVDDSCKTSGNPYIKSPTHCQYCGEELVNSPVLRCVNNECPSRVVGKITNYIEKMNIEDISIGIVSTLFKHGYLRSIEDLYNLERYKYEIIELSGFGPKSYSNIVKGVEKRKTVLDYALLGAIGIPDIGAKIFKKILDIYYIDELKEIALTTDVKKLTDIHGIKEKTAEKIISGLLQNMNLINYLETVLTITHDNRKYNGVVCFTNVRDKEFEKFLDSKNIEVANSYKKSVNMVICDNDRTESDKIKKATKDGKDILTINEAYKFFNYRG
jgi:DNA ligase (NAD+)